MDYKLAQELKDAGFPQIIKGGSRVYIPPEYSEETDDDFEPIPEEYEIPNGETDSGFYGMEIENGKINWVDNDLHGQSVKILVFIPTLSQLIEACGEGLEMLITLNPDDKKSWEAGKFQWADGYSWTLDEREPHGEGSTPEEAIARLWLALNKKQ